MPDHNISHQMNFTRIIIATFNNADDLRNIYDGSIATCHMIQLIEVWKSLL